jgi:hypothetical protein
MATQQEITQLALAKEAAAPAAADYPNLEAAVIGAQRQLRASHIVDRGGDDVSIYNETPQGYVEHRLFRKGGGFHWNLHGSPVRDLPSGAQLIWQWEESRAGAAPPMRMAAEEQMAAEEARREEKHKGGFHLVFLPVNQAWAIYMGGGEPDTWTRIAGPAPYEEMKAQWDDMWRGSSPGGWGANEIEGPEPEEFDSSGIPAHPDFMPGDTPPTPPTPPIPPIPPMAKENPIEIESVEDVEVLPPKAGSCGTSSPGECIPWVKVTRDPERYQQCLARAHEIGMLNTPRKIYDLLAPALAAEDQETFVVVLLDVRTQLRGVAEVHRGSRSRVSVSVPDVMRAVIAAGAEGFVVAHNHPTGTAEPSEADGELTKAIHKGAELFKPDTSFLDHIVIGLDEYYSFTEGKLTRI